MSPILQKQEYTRAGKRYEKYCVVLPIKLMKSLPWRKGDNLDVKVISSSELRIINTDLKKRAQEE